MRKKILIAFIFVGVLVVTYSILQAKSVFLPDWQEGDFGFEGKDTSQDENLCITAEDPWGDPLYHLGPNCPAPKIFDETCPFDENYITECYCPYEFSETCTGPDERGDTRQTVSGHYICDGLYVGCCNTSCGGGYTYRQGCADHIGYNGCGDSCWGEYKACCSPMGDEQDQGCGTYTCDNGCGTGTRQCANYCPPPTDPGDGSSGSGSSSGSDPTPTPDPGPVDPGESCKYTFTASSCSSSCKNVGSQSCTRNGTTYYSSCGSSKCSSSQKCENGTCKNETPTETCNYYRTYEYCGDSCFSAPKGPTCVRNGTTYYADCQGYRCNSNQECKNSKCVDKGCTFSCSGADKFEYKGDPSSFCRGKGYAGANVSSCNGRTCVTCYGKSCSDGCSQMISWGCPRMSAAQCAAARGTYERCTDSNCNLQEFCCGVR